MTQPVGLGFPDWGRQVSQSDVLIVRQNTAINNLVNLGPFYVGNTPYIDVHMHPDVAARVTLSFYQSSTVANVLSNDGMVVTAAGDGRVTFPVGGPWVVVTIQMAAYPNNPHLDVIAVGAPVMHPGLDGSDGILFTVSGAAILNGAVATLDAPRVRAGWATFAGATGAPTYTFELWALDFFGVATYLAEFNQVSGRQPYTVAIPPMPIRVIIRNGALNTIYNVGLTMRPMVGGA